MKRTQKWLAVLGACIGVVLPADIAHADTFVNPTGPAEGACLASGSGGITTGCFGPTFAISGTGTAGTNSCSSTAVAVSVTGSACAAPDGTLTTAGYPISGVAISGTGSASSDSIAVSGTHYAYAPITISGKVLDPGPPFPGCLRGILDGFKGYWCPDPFGGRFFVPDPWDN